MRVFVVTIVGLFALMSVGMYGLFKFDDLRSGGCFCIVLFSSVVQHFTVRMMLTFREDERKHELRMALETDRLLKN